MHVQFKNEDIVEEDDGSNITLSLELNSSLVKSRLKRNQAVPEILLRLFTGTLVRL